MVMYFLQGNGYLNRGKVGLKPTCQTATGHPGEDIAMHCTSEKASSVEICPFQEGIFIVIFPRQLNVGWVPRGGRWLVQPLRGHIAPKCPMA